MIESLSPTTVVPSPKRKKHTRKAHKRLSEHYESLLRRLQSEDFGPIGEVPCALGVTSCHRREGVTTVAVNLAVAAATAFNQPTLLVDANVVRPSLHKIFRTKMTAGLIGATSGDANVFECVVESHIDNLSFLPSGRPRLGREPVYAARTIDETLDSLKHVFPLIVFDLPPATQFTTCLAFAGKLDGVLLAVEAVRVDRKTADQTRRRLAESKANLVGVVFNKFS